MDQAWLQNGRWRACIRPDLGGALARCETRVDAGWVPVLRPSPAGMDDVLQSACFPMAPFCGRVRGGRFVFRGREVVLPPVPGQGMPLHGFVWRAPWQVATHADDRLVIHCDHPAGAWPWPFRATQEFTLAADGISIALSVRNTGTEPMPCGLGLHTYFACDAGTCLSAAVLRHVRMDAQILPVGDAIIAASDRLDRRLIHRLGLDDSFEGWDGIATIEYPAQALRLRLASPGTSRLHVYAPAGEDYCCIEPMGHRIDAFHLDESGFAGAGMRVLAPDESTGLQLRLSLS